MPKCTAVLFQNAEFQSLLSFLCEAANRERAKINVQCLTPALVATNMTFYKEGSLFVKTAEDFVQEAINTIGIVTKTTGCFNHEMQVMKNDSNCMAKNLWNAKLISRLYS